MALTRMYAIYGLPIVTIEASPALLHNPQCRFGCAVDPARVVLLVRDEAMADGRVGPSAHESVALRRLLLRRCRVTHRADVVNHLRP